MKNKKEQQLTFNLICDGQGKSIKPAFNKKNVANKKNCSIESIEDRLKIKQKKEDIKIFHSILSRTRHTIS